MRITYSSSTISLDRSRHISTSDIRYTKKFNLSIKLVSSKTKASKIVCGFHWQRSSLSRGWRQRAGIAVAIINKPQVLILDEPASGLDPESRSELSIILKKLHSQGVHILVSSHILSELEEYCESMLVLRNGEIKEHIKLNSNNLGEPINLIINFTQALKEVEILLIKKLVTGECNFDNSLKEPFQFLRYMHGKKCHQTC